MSDLADTTGRLTIGRDFGDADPSKWMEEIRKHIDCSINVPDDEKVSLERAEEGNKVYLIAYASETNMESLKAQLEAVIKYPIDFVCEV